MYALFEYYGDGIMVPNNFLCLRYGEPGQILNWLMNNGYIREVYGMAQYMGIEDDMNKFDYIMELNYKSKVTEKDISKINIEVPSCCTCICTVSSAKKLNKIVETIEEWKAKPHHSIHRSENEYNIIIQLLVEVADDQEKEKLLMEALNKEMYL